MDEMPDKVVSLDVLRINHNVRKKCQCRDRSFEVDTANREICCDSCGAIVDPYEAMLELANYHQTLNKQTEALFEQRRQLSNYKPHLVVIKELERRYRGRKMLPCCPKCDQTFYLEEISSWVDAEFEEKRRERSETD